MSTLYQKFINDPEVIAAKEQLLKALSKHQSALSGVKAPHHDLADVYENELQTFYTNRGAPLFYRYLGSGLGNGCLVELGDGSVKYDLISGIGVHHFGHSHPQVIKAALDAALTSTVMQGNLQQTQASSDFLKLILKAANRNQPLFEHGFLTCTGAMAGENALKLAFHKNQPKDRVFVFEKCFMGRTLALSQFTDKPAYRMGLPLNYKIDYVPFFDPENKQASTKRALEFIQNQIKRYPDSHAAMSFELILGEGGFFYAEADFYKTLMTELKKHNIAILVDEVQSFARTSELFAFQHFGLDEFVDVVWFGKASQVCGTLYKSTFKPKPGLLSQTFTGASTAIVAGHKIIQMLLEENYFGPQGKIQKLHQEFKKRLLVLSQKFPQKIEGPFGIGAMIGFTSFGGDAAQTLTFIKKLFDKGVIAFNAGDKPARVRFLPPVGAITTTDLDEVFKIIESTINEMS